VNPDFRLRDGSKVAVIGGGAAGSFCAHFAGLLDVRLQSALFLNTIALLFRKMKNVLAGR
jgi:predicted flavoprotein YhiN